MALRRNYGCGGRTGAGSSGCPPGTDQHPPNCGATTKDNMTANLPSGLLTLPAMGEKPPRKPRR